ncbi:MAG: cytochrome c oxidase assembly protein [Acidimicrobiales bacterium]
MTMSAAAALKGLVPHSASLVPSSVSLAGTRAAPHGASLAGHAAPLSWAPHPVAWVVLAGIALAYALVVGRLGPSDPFRPPANRRQLASFAGGWLCLFVATTWPLADLARDWSLSAHMIVQLLLVLGAPPLLLLGLPRWLLSVITRPAPLDAVLRALTTPWVATLVFCGSVVASLLPVVIAAEASSGAVQGAVDVGLVVAGLIMWLPALRLMPGVRHLSTAGRVAYLFVQSLLPNFPALVFIFAQHSLYTVYTRHAGVLGIGVLADQQIAGALAKVVGIAVLWGVAAVIWVRAERAESAGQDPDPLTWEDVERELRRVERRPGRESDAH